MYNNIPIRVCTCAISYCWHLVVRLHRLTYQDQTLHRVITLVRVGFTDISEIISFFFLIENRRFLDDTPKEGKIHFLLIKLTIRDIILNSERSDKLFGLKLSFYFYFCGLTSSLTFQSSKNVSIFNFKSGLLVFVERWILDTNKIPSAFQTDWEQT